MQSHKTAILLGAARGAAILAAAERGLPVFEYAPKRIKQATVGRGNADKNQVAFMIRALLGLTETPDADAADALAIGLDASCARRKPPGWECRGRTNMRRQPIVQFGWLGQSRVRGCAGDCRKKLVAEKRAILR